MRKRKDVVQVMNVKYKGERLECTKCSHSMMVVDIIYDFIGGKLEHLTVVDGDKVYQNLNYDAFYNLFYHELMDLYTYTIVCNNLIFSVNRDMALKLGENITTSEKQQKLMKCENGKIHINSKAIRSCNDNAYNFIPKNVEYMIANIYKGVGYMCYDKQFKGRRFGLEATKQSTTQRDIFSDEFANIMLLKTEFGNCKQNTNTLNNNTKKVFKILKDNGFNLD